MPLVMKSHRLNSDDNPYALEEDLLTSFRVNVIGSINTINAFMPLVHKSSIKKVIAISSGMADPDLVLETTMDTGAPYAISKAGVNMVISKYNAAYKSAGVLFMAICPGWADTSGGTIEQGKSRTYKLGCSIN